MSLVTRCSSCATVFRVVQDQLKVSEGWVRCGRCDQVFNALEGLFDLQRDAPAGWAQGDSPSTRGEPPEVAMPAASPVPDVAIAEVTVDEPRAAIEHGDAEVGGTRRGAERSTPAARIDERDRLEFPDAQFDPELAAETPSLDDSSASDRSDATLSDLPEPEATPAFLGSQATTTRRRALQSVLYGLVGALALMLAAQAAHHFRDLIAARWPAARPALLAWCATVRCVVAPPQRIDEVSVESTALTRSSTADAFNLSVALRNRGELTLAVPSVDLSLTDPTGQLVARRVLTPRDFRMTSATMPPLAETNLRATLTAGESRVTGYTVEVFYP